jgi:hypothetical protein
MELTAFGVALADVVSVEPTVQSEDKSHQAIFMKLEQG